MMTLIFRVEFRYWWDGCEVSGQRAERAGSGAEARLKTREWIAARLGLGTRAQRVAKRAALQAVPV